MEDVGVSPWRGKRVLVTGHTGFKGAWLSFLLWHFGADVTGFALPPATEPNLFDILRLRGKVKSFFGDVRDLGSFQAIARAANPDVLFHLAGQAEVRTGYSDPLLTFDVNVMGTANVLNVARALPELRSAVVITSDKCYRNDGRSAGYSEGDPLGGDDPYSASKACAELVTAAFRESYFQSRGCAVATARAGNVVGGGDWASDRLIPDVIRALLNRNTLNLRYPRATRPWQHVLEALSGYLRLALELWRSPGAAVGAWNFGPTRPALTVAELVSALSAAWGQPISWAHEPAEEPESQKLALDARRASDGLGWHPHLTNDEVVGWTIDWYKGWQSGLPMESLTEQQIESYWSRERSA